MASSDSGGDFFAGLIIGGIVGAAVALVLAPQTGAETREQLRSASIEFKDRANEAMAEAREKAEAITADARRRAEEIMVEARAKADEIAVEARKKAEGIELNIPKGKTPKAGAPEA